MFHFCVRQNCEQLTKTVEDTGAILREIRDLEDQVRTVGRFAYAFLTVVPRDSFGAVRWCDG